MKDLNTKNKINLPPETDELVHISKIEIPEAFEKTRCGHNKIRWAKEYYQRNGRFDKSISVVKMNGVDNTKVLLLDEYSRYLAAKDLKCDIVPVKYIDIYELEK